MIQAVARDLPALVATMLASGLRLGEACALLWRSVDFMTGTLEVEATVVRVKGKGMLRKSTKTTAGHRTLRLPRWCVDMLRERALPGLVDANVPVFPAPKGNIRDPSNTAADLRDAFDKAGFAWATSHVLRKTTASVGCRRLECPGDRRPARSRPTVDYHGPLHGQRHSG